jgi:hypothetical protein
MLIAALSPFVYRYLAFAKCVSHVTLINNTANHFSSRTYSHEIALATFIRLITIVSSLVYFILPQFPVLFVPTYMCTYFSSHASIRDENRSRTRDVRNKKLVFVSCRYVHFLPYNILKIRLACCTAKHSEHVCTRHLLHHL